MPVLPRRLALVTCTSSGHRVDMKRRGVPQFVQKPRSASSEQTNHFRCSRPASLKLSATTPNQVTTGAPWCCRQEMQLQCAHHLTGRLTTYLTDPQAQLPMATDSSLIV